MSLTHIHVRGARQHNLRDVSVSIPRNTLTVVTGPSGLQELARLRHHLRRRTAPLRRDVVGVRAQFLDQMERLDVDSIEGSSPAISIEQKTTSRSPRSTVGTITEIYDYLRLLWASVGQPHCPNCHRPIRARARTRSSRRLWSATRRSLRASASRCWHQSCAGARANSGRNWKLWTKRATASASTARSPRSTKRECALEKRKNHTVEAIVDRIILKPVPGEPGASGRAPLDTRRLQTAVTTALQLANGLVLIGLQAPGGEYHETLFSSSMACPDCGINVPKLEPRSFSFNSSYGACPECHGLGSIYDFDPAKTIADWSKPLLDGAMGPGSASQYLQRLIKLAAEKYKINLKKPFEELSKADQELLLYGPPRPEAARTGFHGIIPWLRDTLEETKSEGYREYMMQYMSATECPRCHGRRLRPESLAVTIPIADAAEHPPVNRPDRDVEPISSANARRSVSIADFTGLSLERAMMGARSMVFIGRDKLIADRLQREIIERLEFLNAVGLGYLSLIAWRRH